MMFSLGSHGVLKACGASTHSKLDEHLVYGSLDNYVVKIVILGDTHLRRRGGKCALKQPHNQGAHLLENP